MVLKVARPAFAEACSESCHEFMGLHMTPSPLNKQKTSFNSPHDWLMILAIDLAALCDMWRSKRHNDCHLVVFSVNIAFVHHFMATCPTSTHPPTL